MDQERLNIIVLGGGESGWGAALLAQKKGHAVFLSDAGKLKEKFRVKLQESEIPFEEGGHDEERILAADLIVKSPGIPGTVPMVQKARLAGIPIISELEWGYRYCTGTIVAITGIGFFYILTLFMGLGAMTLGVIDVESGNMSAPLVAKAFSLVLFSVISAIAFATVLGTVSGLIVATSGAIAHDLMG